ncbi:MULTISPECIES: XdhC/CoxI family protein [unclassified Streptomyces]|uniref:XdhC/CoxI family protein n=1 Tax=unclassified Streptomyces TaxID=2593676 RepID=UPI002E302040|nr:MULTISPECIES: XdhC/CoxI family protein [unclassified Streptomyces]
MREILPALNRWYRAGSPFGLATVVSVSRSAPRDPGAAMAVGPGDEVVGSVSGGCVEGAVFELAREVVASGEARVETFGYSDEDAFAVGLTCGGEISLLVRRVTPGEDPSFGAVAESVAAGRAVTVATVLAGPAPLGAVRAVWPDEAAGSLGSPGLDAAVTADARGELAQGATVRRHYGRHGERREDEVTVFLQSFAPPPRMLVFGAIDYAAAVARVGDFLGYRVTVCDARPVFATPKRFPAGVEVVVDWPHRYLRGTTTDARTVICVLTHDPKFDVPLLEEALRRPAAYIGAMGSRRTHDDRTKRLVEAGVRPDELSRLRSPVGLDLGARTPEEVAVSVAAEIVALRWGGTGAPLTLTDGEIHPRGLGPPGAGTPEAVRGGVRAAPPEGVPGGVPAAPPEGAPARSPGAAATGTPTGRGAAAP